MYDMICMNLVTVNDLWSPIHCMECGNLVTVNDSYGPPIPDMECRSLVYGSPTCTILFFLRTMQCGNLVTVNDLYGMWEHCNWVTHMYDMIFSGQCNVGTLLLLMTYCPSNTLYGMQAPCNWVPQYA